MQDFNSWGSYSDLSVTYRTSPITEAAPSSKPPAGNLTHSQALQAIYGNKVRGVMGEDTLSAIERIILQLVSQSNQDRMTYFKLLNEFENYYLCQAIYDVLIEDILRDDGTGVLIKVESEKYQSICEEAMKKFNIPALVESCLPQLLHYGDYAYRVNKSFADDQDPIGKITSISDDFLPGEVLSVYNNNTPVACYRLPQVRTIRDSAAQTNVGGSVLDDAEKLSLADVIHFSLKSNKIKLELESKYREAFACPVLNVGIGVLWPVIDRLVLLKFREITTTATDLSRLTRPTIVGANVPQSDSTDKIMEHCKKMEEMLNTTNVDISSYTGNFITAITAAMGNNYKVIPAFSSGRGEARKLGIESEINTSDDDRKIESERDLVCQLSGIPPEVVLAGTESRQSPQRVYVRLNKRIKSIQRCISRSITQFLVHYVATETENLEVTESDIRVTMNQSSNLEDIDDSEALGYVLDNVKNIIDAAESIKRSKLLGSTPSQVGPHGEIIEGEGISPIDGQRLLSYLLEEFKSSGTSAADIWKTPEEILAEVSNNKEASKSASTPKVADTATTEPSTDPDTATTEPSDTSAE